MNDLLQEINQKAIDAVNAVLTKANALSPINESQLRAISGELSAVAQAHWPAAQAALATMGHIVARPADLNAVDRDEGPTKAVRAEVFKYINQIDGLANQRQTQKIALKLMKWNWVTNGAGPGDDPWAWLKWAVGGIIALAVLHVVLSARKSH